MLFPTNEGRSALLAAILGSGNNNPPVANDQNLSTNEDTSLSVTLTASDAEGDSLTFSIVNNPSKGALSGTAPNVTYTPNGNFNGSDSFTFKVNDGAVDSDMATVTITVNAVNDAPVADDQSVTTDEDTSEGILLTASDVEGDSLTFRLVGGPTKGALSGTAPNVTYTPNGNFNGSDSFTFKANDGTEDGNTATVSITVNAVNDKPAADSQSVATQKNNSKSITLTGSDLDVDTLTFSIVASPANGSLSGAAPNLTYTPAVDYNGPDSFTFIVNDGTMDSDVATVNITVTVGPVNKSPAADNQTLNTNEDNDLAITLTGSDTENDPLSFLITVSL